MISLRLKNKAKYQPLHKQDILEIKKKLTTKNAYTLTIQKEHVKIEIYRERVMHLSVFLKPKLTKQNNIPPKQQQTNKKPHNCI